MRTITAKKLSKENFDLYGSFADMENPVAPHLGAQPCEFYHDMVSACFPVNNLGLSVTRTYKRDMIIQDFERHDFTDEVIMPINGDIVIHLAPASGKDHIPYDDVEAFCVPKGTLVTIKQGVWHSGPFSAKEAVVSVLVALPVRTYNNDCKIECFPVEKQIVIKLL